MTVVAPVRSVDLSPQQSRDVTALLTQGIVAKIAPQPDEHVVVRLATGVQLDLAGLGALLLLLWRRVGADGKVTVSGLNSDDLHTLESLGLDPRAVRARVYGPPG